MTPFPIPGRSFLLIAGAVIMARRGGAPGLASLGVLLLIPVCTVLLIAGAVIMARKRGATVLAALGILLLHALVITVAPWLLGFIFLQLGTLLAQKTLSGYALIAGFLGFLAGLILGPPVVLFPAAKKLVGQRPPGKAVAWATAVSVGALIPITVFVSRFDIMAPELHKQMLRLLPLGVAGATWITLLFAMREPRRD